MKDTGPSYGHLAGNRTVVSVNGAATTSTSYDAADQVQGWTYDQAGNLINDGTTSYNYDALNHLTATTGAQTSSYRYNGDGTLVGQITNGAGTSYTQDLAAGQSQILAAATSLTSTDYLYGNDTAPFVALTGGTRTWYGTDGQGSVRQTLDDSANVLGTQSYDPFGRPETGSTLVSSFGYTGELQNSSTGAEYLRARWYQPGTGQLLGVDPLLASTGQPYSYASDNPVNGSDPSGKCLHSFFGIVYNFPTLGGVGWCSSTISTMLDQLGPNSPSGVGSAVGILRPSYIDDTAFFCSERTHQASLGVGGFLIVLGANAASGGVEGAEEGGSVGEVPGLIIGGILGIVLGVGQTLLTSDTSSNSSSQPDAPHPGALSGTRSFPNKVQPKDDATTKRSYQLEDDSADALVKAGFDVNQNPDRAELAAAGYTGPKNPDYIVAGVVADNFGPSSSNPDSIWLNAQGKAVTEQASWIVINTTDSKVNDTALLDGFKSEKPNAVDRITIVRNGKVVGDVIYPKSS